MPNFTLVWVMVQVFWGKKRRLLLLLLGGKEKWKTICFLARNRYWMLNMVTPLFLATLEMVHARVCYIVYIYLHKFIL